MSEFIGLRSYFIDNWLHYVGKFSHSNNSAILKQQALFFDRIGITDLNDPIFLPTNRKISDLELLQWRDELEWLRDKNVVFAIDEPKVEVADNEIIKSLFDKARESVIGLVGNHFTLSDIAKTKGQEGKSSFDEILYGPYSKNMIRSLAIILRILSLQIELSKKASIVPLLSFSDYSYEIPTSIKNDVAEIVINRLPIPSNTVPWEAIIDYRNDPETQKSLRALRNWIRKVSSENASPVEISDELETLIDEYQSHMKLHKLKANTETLEVITKAPLEIIENLVKIKFSKIPEPFFAFKKRQISLFNGSRN
jgi:hypothetical protein